MHKQGVRIPTMTRILFVCTENRLRSPTAEAVFCKYDDVDAIGAGTNAMEKSRRNKISSKFRKQLKNERPGVFDIPANYEYMDPMLIQLLQNRIPKLVNI